MAKKLPKVKSRVRNSVVVADPSEDIFIGPDLTKEMANQPGLYAYYAAMAEEATAATKRAKYAVLCLQEDLDEKIRKQAARREEKVTEAAIKARINRHPDMREAFEKYMSAKRRSGLLHVYKIAFEQRADMLRSIGANMRSEFGQGEIRTLQRKASRVAANLGVKKTRRSTKDDE